MLVGYRSGEWMDLVADAVGVGLGAGVVPLLLPPPQELSTSAIAASDAVILPIRIMRRNSARMRPGPTSRN